MVEGVQFNLLVKDLGSSSLSRFARNAEKTTRKVNRLFTSTQKKAGLVDRQMRNLGGRKELQFNRQLRVANGHLDRLTGKMARLQAMGANRGGVGARSRRGGGLLAGIGGYIAPIAIAAGFASMINSASKFESKLIDIKGILSTTEGFGQASFEGLTKTIRKVGEESIFSASQVGSAAKFLAMAGLNIQQIEDSLPAVTRIAAIGDLDVSRASDIITNISTGYGIAANRMNDVADVLSGTFTKTNVTLEEQGEAFKYVGNIAAQSGLRFEELSAAVGVLGNAGIKGSQAGTNLRRLILRLSAPAEAGKKVMEKYGLSFTRLTKDGRTVLKPLAQIAKEVNALNMSAGDKKDLFGVFGGQAMGALATQKTADGELMLDKVTKELSEVGGLSKKLADAKMKSFAGQLAIMKANFESLAVSIFKKVQPGLTTVFKSFTRFFKFLRGEGKFILDGIGKGFIVLGNVFKYAFSGLQRLLIFAKDNWHWLKYVAGGALALVGVLRMFRVAKTAIGIVSGLKMAFLGLNTVMRANPVGLIITGIQILAVALIYAWNKFEGFRSAIFTGFNLLGLVFKGVQTWLGNIGHLLGMIWSGLLVPFGQWIGGFFGKLWEWGKNAWAGWSMFFDKIGQKLEPLKIALKSFFATMKVVAAPVFEVFSSIGDFFNNIWGKIVTFAKKIAENEWVKAIFGASSFGLMKAIADQGTAENINDAVKRGKESGANASTFSLSSLTKAPLMNRSTNSDLSSIDPITSSINADLGADPGISDPTTSSGLSISGTGGSGGGVVFNIGNLLAIENSYGETLEDGRDIKDAVADALLEAVRDVEIGLSS